MGGSPNLHRPSVLPNGFNFLFDPAELKDSETKIDLLGRIPSAALFLTGALQKTLDPRVAPGLLTGVGAPGWPVSPALGLNLVLAVGLLVPRTVYPTALAAAISCTITSHFHLQPQDGWRMSIFVTTWAYTGGLRVRAASSKPQSFSLPGEIVTLALDDATFTGAFAASFFGFFTSLRLFMPLAMTASFLTAPMAMTDTKPTAP